MRSNINKTIKIAAACLLSCLASYQATGSHISLETRLAVTSRKNVVSLKADITNRGDEPAMSVQIEAGVGSVLSKSKLREELRTNETFHALFEIGAIPQPAGEYTVLAKIHYTDANGYPFTGLQTIPLAPANLVAPDKTISAHASSCVIRKHGELELTLRSSPDSNPVNVRATLVLPDEFECSEAEVNVPVLPGEQKKTIFKIHNISGRPGSQYYSFIIINYMYDNQHRSISVPANITVGHSLPHALLQKSMLPLTILSISLLAIFFLAAQFPNVSFRLKCLRSPARSATHNVAGGSFIINHSSLTFLILLILLLFTLWHLQPKYLVTNTLTTGGDIPAHNYLASHLEEQLLEHGRIVSWSNGWWSGFPMFQFYFTLPYLLIGILDIFLPFNIAFKIVSVLGILILPGCAYMTARMMRLPRPGPILLAIAMIPLLFDHSHNMWGVNIYSTLAGMIANSISFSVMLLFVGSASIDCDEGQFRLRTVLLLAALIGSHFFTTIVAVLTVSILPFLRPRAEMRKAVLVLCKECGLGFLLMAWWLIPLVIKREYSMDFGSLWEFSFFKKLPSFIFWLTPFIFAAIVLGIIRRVRFVVLTACMLMFAIILFCFGYSYISEVFVNVRLWPFIVYSLLALSAAGIGLIIEKLKASELAVICFLIAALTFGIDKPNHVRNWAKWNYEGLEKKTAWPVFRDLVLPLKGTPGRLANDLHDRNNMLGSSRIFECVPHLIGKPVLEGGIVNSAAGSMFSYYIQGETSKNCAGFPPIVKPAKFNFRNATKHLELFNVKHFIARWSETKTAMTTSPHWRLAGKAKEWELYELMTHNGSYVFIPENNPLAIRTDKWKHAGLDWIYTVNAIDQPFAILRPGEKTNEHFTKVYSEQEYINYLASVSGTSPAKSEIIDLKPEISHEKISDNVIKFKTSAIGKPHIIKVNYYPNWKVRGAKKVYMVTPCFMLVYPEQEEVEIYYGYTFSDNAGRGLTLAGLAMMMVMLYVKRRKK
ncbi:hypothetical protein ACFLS1_02725 [Verrucomicrobiota bacterium]